MQTRRVILVHDSRLLRDLLKHTIEKFGGVEVVRAAADLHNVSSLIRETDAGWLFVALPPGDKLPETLKMGLFLKHPALRIISLWDNGSHAKIEWLGRHDIDMVRPTLKELKTLLR